MLVSEDVAGFRCVCGCVRAYVRVCEVEVGEEVGWRRGTGRTGTLTGGEREKAHWAGTWVKGGGLGRGKGPGRGAEGGGKAYRVYDCSCACVSACVPRRYQIPRLLRLPFTHCCFTLS